MKTLLTKFSTLTFVVIALFSCDFDKTLFNDYKELPVEGWHKDSLAIFDVNVADTTQNYAVLVNVRNRSDYRLQNIWLFLNYQTSDSIVNKDTINLFLADNNGRWLGSGFGSMHEMSGLFISSMKFEQEGNYRFEIQQGMRDTLLTGINDIGLEIIKVN